jgi:serine/threonine-protein kinase
VVEGGSDSTAGVREGDILAGKYRVERVLGIGGMGVVVAAHHIQLDEKVALKFLLPEALGNAEAVARFAREARAAVKIKSEHVARVVDVGQLENGAPYMVMEYLEGGDLDAWIKQRGGLPIEQAVEFVLQACEAIAEAHALGIVHRDLKPANLFCIRRADGRLSIKVLDFGISKVTAKAGSRPDMSMTRTSALVGSPVYMSPEQMEASKDVDSRTDIWSLGVILFELLSGRVPFEGEAVTELAIRIATAAPLRLGDLRPEVPVGLDQVVMWCLEKDPRRRFRDVGALAVALESFGPKRAKASVERIVGILQSAGPSSGESPSDRVETARARVSVGPSGTVASWGRQTGAWTKKQRRNALVGASVAAGLVAVTVAIASISRKGSDAQRVFVTATSALTAVPTTASRPPTSLASPSVSDSSSSTAPTISLRELPIAPTIKTVPVVGDVNTMPLGTPEVAATDLPIARPTPPPTAKSLHSASTITSIERPLLEHPTVDRSPAAASDGPERSCNPPYVDSAGHRRFKPECFGVFDSRH